MATTTPNFGWPVPTSTDLVKDGATAIEGLGDAIDASLLDLKGGTSGQVLKKNSNTDMDFVWSADSAGMTNPMTTTGDTIYSSSGSTPARLGIGSTGQVLTVAGGVPSWATPAAGGSTFSGALVYRNNATGLSIPNNTAVAGVWEVESFDVDGYWNSGAPTRLTIPSGKSGKFLVAGKCEYSSNGTGYRGAGIQKNGGAVNYGSVTAQAVSSGGIGTGVHNAVIVSAVAGDYFEIFYGQNSGSTLTNQPGGGIYYDIFSIAYLGA